VKGNFHLRGPQPVGKEESFAPEWVGKVLEENSDIDAIVVIRKTRGVVYSKME
jgi:hypothetical protein